MKTMEEIKNFATVNNKENKEVLGEMGDLNQSTNSREIVFNYIDFLEKGFDEKQCFWFVQDVVHSFIDRVLFLGMMSGVDYPIVTITIKKPFNTYGDNRTLKQLIMMLEDGKIGGVEVVRATDYVLKESDFN